MLLKRVLLVDDDPRFVLDARAALHGVVELHVATDAHCALDAAVRLDPDLVLVDPLLRGVDAFWLLDELRRRLCGATPAVICLAKGPGARRRAQLAGGEFFGVHLRDAGPQALRAAVLQGLGVGDAVAV